MTSDWNTMQTTATCKFSNSQAGYVFHVTDNTIKLLKQILLL